MPSGQFLPTGLLLLVFLGVVLPAYGFITGEFIWVWNGVILGGILFIVKWRWWWHPLRAYVTTDNQSN